MSSSLFEIKIKRATAEDAEDVMKVTKDAFRKYKEALGLEGDPDALKESIEDVRSDIEKKYVFIVRIDHETVGAVRVALYDDHTAYLSRFAVDEDHRNTGIGKMLMRAVDKVMTENDIKRLYLDTSSKVGALIRFYYGRGFYITEVEYSRGYPRAKLVKDY